jgi:hypothetical protein
LARTHYTSWRLFLYLSGSLTLIFLGFFFLFKPLSGVSCHVALIKDRTGFFLQEEYTTFSFPLETLDFTILVASDS